MRFLPHEIGETIWCVDVLLCSTIVCASQYRLLGRDAHLRLLAPFATAPRFRATIRSGHHWTSSTSFHGLGYASVAMCFSPTPVAFASSPSATDCRSRWHRCEDYEDPTIYVVRDTVTIPAPSHTCPNLCLGHGPRLVGQVAQIFPSSPYCSASRGRRV